MNDRKTQTAQLRNAAHAALLLILVPVVFYGGYQLISHSATIDSEPLYEGKTPVDSWSHESTPSPGTVWLAEVDRLRGKLSSISREDPAQMEARNRLDDQLRLIHQHCESHRDEVHRSIDRETPLGRTLMGIAEAIDRLPATESTRPQPPSWESAFEDAESARLTGRADQIDTVFQEQFAPIRKEYATRFDALHERNRDLAFKVKNTLLRIEQVERETQEKIESQERLQAYEQDRDEIARLLKPFITPGYTQLRDSGNDWKLTAEQKPLSVNDLKRVGALATDIDGLRIFARIGGMPVHMAPKTARPLGAFPAFYDNTLSNPTHLETVKRAQQLILQHAETLIENGLLLP